MKNKLKEITDSTINELLCNEIILPSNYFQCFDKHAKIIDISIDNDSFEKELNELILDEFNTINTYINDAVKTIDQAASLTLDAQEAIKNQNVLVLKNLYTQIKELKVELQDMTNNIYKDYLTKVNNKKWFYHKYLDKEANYKKDATIALIDVSDYDYISENYSKLISNNLLIYIATYFQNKLKEENLNFEITRYLINKFIITLEESDLVELEILMSTISNILYNTTLKSNSGVMIKPTFKYSIIKIKKNESFHESFDLLIKNIKSAKMES